MQNSNYLENKALLQSQQTWFSSNGDGCSDFTSGVIGYFCRTDNLYVAIDASGGVNTSVQNINCPVMGNGLSYCS